MPGAPVSTGRLDSLHLYPVKGCHRIDVTSATLDPWGLAGDRRWLPVDADGTMVSQREVRDLTAVRPVLLDGGLRLTAPEVAGLDDLDVLTDAAVAGQRVDGRVGEQVQASVWGNEFSAVSCGPEADDWISRAAGRSLRLVWMDDPTRRPVEDSEWSRPGDVVSAADGYPLLLASAASLAALNDWIREESSPDEVVPMTRFRPNLVVSGFPAWAEDDWSGRRIRVGEATFRVAGPCARCVMTTTDQESGERRREPLRTLARHRNVDKQLLFAVNLLTDGPGTLRVGDEVELLD